MVDNTKILTDSDIHCILNNMLNGISDYFKDHYYANDLLHKNVADQLLIYVHSLDDKIYQDEYYVKIIQYSNTLTINDINIIIEHVLNNPHLIHSSMLPIMQAVHKQYPNIIDEINYHALLEKNIHFLVGRNFRVDTIDASEWMLMSDDIARIIIHKFITEGNINRFINQLNIRGAENSNTYALPKIMNKLITAREQFLEKFNSTNNYLTVNDFVEHYGLSKDLLLGVMI